MAADPNVPPLMKRGVPRAGKQQAYGDAKVSYGTSAVYVVRRLKRDAPEIAEALARGEFPSAQAAAIAGGVIKPKPLVLARYAWKLMSTEERGTFLAEIGATPRP
jgi:hypothetical protein